MAYENLIDQIIDKANPDFADFPDSLDGETYLGGDAETGWMTRSNVVINATNISARQLYLQLNAINKWDSLQTILTAPGNEFLQGLFDRSHDFLITDQYVMDMAALLNEDLQAFFNAASLL